MSTAPALPLQCPCHTELEDAQVNVHNLLILDRELVCRVACSAQQYSPASWLLPRPSALAHAAGAKGTMDSGSVAEDDEVKTAPPPTPRPTKTFIMVDGKCASSLVPLRQAIARAGLTITKEFRVTLNHVEARRFLAAAGPSMEEARAALAAAKVAEEAKAAEAAAAAAAAAKGKKGKPPPEPEPEADDGAGEEEEDDDPRPPLKPFDPVVRPQEVK